MPRRQIRSVNANVDLSRHLRESESLPATVSSESLFAAAGPLELEIGSGKGLFLSAVAPANPNTYFVGIEIVHKYAKLAANRVAKTGVSNALMISGDAGPIMANQIADETLDAVHVYFPDPWWKKRHRQRRVVSSQTLPQIDRCLRTGGRFYFWTDVLDYFTDTIELIAETLPHFGVPIPDVEKAAEHDLDYRTHFERRSIQNQIPVYRVHYIKRNVGGS